jgi:histidinol-phosphate aminotransferase
MRIGYAIGDRHIIDYVNRVRRPFNANSIAQEAALAALDDSAHIRASCEAARASIAAIHEAAAAVGFRSYPSLCNFVLVDVGGGDSDAMYEKLLRKGVIVRPMGAWGLPRCVRISVASAADTARIAAALREAAAS